MGFVLHDKLSADTVCVGRFSLCLVLLSRDASYPWCLLVPEVAGATELHELSHDQQHQLTDESDALAKAMVALFQPDTMNVAALGNVVSQLHIHHVVRQHSDPAWPAPIWGAAPPKAYEPKALDKRVAKLQRQLSGPNFTAYDRAEASL